MSEDEVSISAVIDEALRFVAKQAEEKQISVILDIADDCPRLRGDATALVRIVVNLLSNAVKFTPVDGRVTVRAGEDDETIMFSGRNGET